MRDRAQINDVHVQGASEVFTPGVSQPHIVHVPPGCLSLISPTYPRGVSASYRPRNPGCLSLISPTYPRGVSASYLPRTPPSISPYMPVYYLTSIATIPATTKPIFDGKHMRMAHTYIHTHIHAQTHASTNIYMHKHIHARTRVRWLYLSSLHGALPMTKTRSGISIHATLCRTRNHPVGESAEGG